MEKNQRDEMNFHVFFNLMRKKHKVTMEEVCEGICSKSMMNRIETGERLPDKLTRDRLLQRMGVAQETYQDYLMGEEYETYELRESLLNSIEDNHYSKSRCAFKAYENWWSTHGKEEMSKVEKQFFLAMKYQLYLWELGREGMFLKKLPQEEEHKAKRILEEALELTLGKKSKKKLGLLAEPEIHLLAEYLRFQPRKEALSDYKSLLKSVEESKVDAVSRAKIYPLLVCYFLNKSKEAILTKEEWEENLSFCERAIQHLLGSGRNFFFVELIELWEECYKALGKPKYVFSFLEENSNLHEIYKERKAWKSMFLELYGRYGLSAYRKNFAYLYRQTRSYHAGEVIKIRRKMFGYSSKRLCEGICSEKTLTRLENKKAKTQMPVVRELLERLNLHPEYIRARVVTNDFHVLERANLLAIYLNTEEIEKAETVYLRLKEELCMEILQNRQYLRQMEEEIKLKKKEISPKEFSDRMEEILEITLKKEYLYSEEIFLSREEEALSYRIFMEQEESNTLYGEVIKKCLQFYRERGIKTFLTNYEFLLTWYCSYLGNRKEYEESNRLCEELIPISLSIGRIVMTAQNLYNLIWNNWQEYPGLDKEMQCKDLYYCIYLSRIEKDRGAELFFRKKLKKEYEK